MFCGCFYTFFFSEGPLKEVFNYKITPDNSTIEMIDLGEALGGMREATAEIVGNSLVSYLKVPGPSGEIDMIATRSMAPSKYFIKRLALFPPGKNTLYVQSYLVIRNILIRNKLVLSNHFL